MSDLGDLSDFFKEGSIEPFSKEGSTNDVSWLAVDDAEYRAHDVLPKQNLDIAPDLQAMWAHEDKPSTAYLPKDHRPATMGDLSTAHGPLRARPEDIIRTARLALMQSTDPARLRNALTTRFDTDSLHMSRTALAGVLAERGLLGRFYIEASDFPGCHRSPKQVVDFVRRFAADAKFVVAKSECQGCTHAIQLPTGAVNCATFHKQLVVEVPYTEAVAESVERLQAAKGKQVQASSASPKERIRLALLADSVVADAQAASTKPVVNPAQYMKPTVAAEAVVLAPDLTHHREAARAEIDLALRAGRLSVTDAKTAFRTVAAAGDADVITQVTAAVRAATSAARPVYIGAGEQAPLAPVSSEQVTQQIIAAEALTRKRDEAARAVVAARKAEPILALLRREMLKGRSEADLVGSLRLAFSMTDLQETRAHWEPLFKEAGLFGAVYTKQEVFADCREGADFVTKHNPGIRAVVAGAKCDGCVYNKIGRCLLYSKPLVKAASDLVTWETAEAVLQDHRIAGRISADVRVASTGATPADALKAMYRAAATKPGPQVAGVRQHLTSGFYGSGAQHITAGITKREVVKTASKYMNEGLYGKQLLAALQSRFDPRDIEASLDDLRPVLAEQGLQGIYFVDPTIYDDYGKGCDEPARLFRAKLVEFVKAGSKCGSCVHQQRAGFCSKINKALVVEPPYLDKAAQQQAILSSGEATEVPYEKIVNNGLSMIAEYQLQNGAFDFELDKQAASPNIEVEFGDGQKVKG